jgi:hypothetical protein
MGMLEATFDKVELYRAIQICLVFVVVSVKAIKDFVSEESISLVHEILVC